jgi:hypothetical protein
MLNDDIEKKNSVKNILKKFQCQYRLIFYTRDML